MSSIVARDRRSGCDGCAVASRAPPSRHVAAADQSAPAPIPPGCSQSGSPRHLPIRPASAVNTSAESEHGTITASGTHRDRRFVAERAVFSLDGNLHSGACFSCGRVDGVCSGGWLGQTAFSNHTTAQPRLLGSVHPAMVSYLRSHTSAATKTRKTMAMTPFIVKNAAFRRRISLGETRECSYASSSPAAATPSQPEIPKLNSYPNQTSSASMVRCIARATQNAASIPSAWGMLCKPASRSCSKSWQA